MPEGYTFAWEQKDYERTYDSFFTAGQEAAEYFQPITNSSDERQPLWQMGYVKEAYRMGEVDGGRIHGSNFISPSNPNYVGNGFENDYRNGYAPGSLAAQAYDEGFIFGRVAKVKQVDEFNLRVETNLSRFSGTSK